MYVDHCSGKDKDLKELQNLFRHLREGGVVHVHSLDRLPRNLKDFMDLLDQMIGKGAEVCFHKENLTFAADKANPMHWSLFQIFGALAELERARVR